jgi:cleavage stimulation factor subunit 1
MSPQLDRNQVLHLIVTQLQYYDFPSIAQVVASATGLVDYSLDPSSRLAELAYLGTQVEKNSDDPTTDLGT